MGSGWGGRRWGYAGAGLRWRVGRSAVGLEGGLVGEYEELGYGDV